MTTATYIQHAELRRMLQQKKELPEGAGVRLSAGGKVLLREQPKPDSDGVLSIRYVYSTDAVDSYDDIIFQGKNEFGAGWRFDRWKTNSPVLWCHNSWGLPIGKGSQESVEKNRLTAVNTFASPDVYKFGADVGRMVAAGLLPANSVGFQPVKLVWNDERGGIDFFEQQLLEDSVCCIGANPEALVDEMSAKAFRAFKAMGNPLEGALEFFGKALDLEKDAPERKLVETLWRELGPQTTYSIPGEQRAPASRKKAHLVVEVPVAEKGAMALKLRGLGMRVLRASDAVKALVVKGASHEMSKAMLKEFEDLEGHQAGAQKSIENIRALHEGKDLDESDEEEEDIEPDDAEDQADDDGDEPEPDGKKTAPPVKTPDVPPAPPPPPPPKLSEQEQFLADCKAQGLDPQKVIAEQAKKEIDRRRGRLS